MKTRIITDSEANDFCVRDESHFFDRKSTKVSGKSVQKISVAFANADGGEVIIGVADDKDEPNPALRWQGVSRIEELNGHLQSIFEINPTLDLRYEFLKCEDRRGYVLRVLIEKSSGVHKTSDGTVYQRYGAQSLPIKDPKKLLSYPSQRMQHHLKIMF